jgi:ankyrin repeat protein
MGHTAIAHYLLSLGAPLDICTAAMLGLARDVGAMLTFDPSLAYATGAHGIPVLYFPVVHGEQAIAEMLLSAGAPVNAGDGMMTPLHAAAAFDQPEMARWLVANGAYTNLLNYDGKTALELAEANGHEAVVTALRELA